MVSICDELINTTSVYHFKFAKAQGYLRYRVNSLKDAMKRMFKIYSCEYTKRCYVLYPLIVEFIDLNVEKSFVFLVVTVFLIIIVTHTV